MVAVMQMHQPFMHKTNKIIKDRDITFIITTELWRLKNSKPFIPKGMLQRHKILYAISPIGGDDLYSYYQNRRPPKKVFSYFFPHQKRKRIGRSNCSESLQR